MVRRDFFESVGMNGRPLVYPDMRPAIYALPLAHVVEWDDT
jgi:hypothetical protein